MNGFKEMLKWRPNSPGAGTLTPKKHTIGKKKLEHGNGRLLLQRTIAVTSFDTAQYASEISLLKPDEGMGELLETCH